MIMKQDSEKSLKDKLSLRRNFLEIGLISALTIASYELLKAGYTFLDRSNWHPRLTYAVTVTKQPLYGADEHTLTQAQISFNKAIIDNALSGLTQTSILKK
ncbi:MAG: hypothetical protein AABX16_02080 [Nanoarchaeota archaeon]